MDTDQCPTCDAKAIVAGHYFSRGNYFEPKGMRFFTFRLRWRAVSFTEPLRACLTCGQVWTHLQPEELRTFIDKYGTAKTKLKLAPFKKGVPEQDLV
jgi:hypothetical protein